MKLRLINIKLTINIRSSFLWSFLYSQVSQWYDLVVFTASMEIYGSPVVERLDNGRGILRRKYYRQVCLMVKNCIPSRGRNKAPEIPYLESYFNQSTAVEVILSKMSFSPNFSATLETANIWHKSMSSFRLFFLKQALYIPKIVFLSYL